MKAHTPPFRCASAITWYTSVVLPDDSGPKISTTRPRGRPPTPRARSSPRQPVEIAATGAESFYQGRLAREIAAFASVTGGTITEADLAAHQNTWVDPIVTDYRGFGVWEIPPNGQGIACLLALNVLEGFDLARHPRDSVESFHLQVEAMKVAFADVRRHVADPDRADVPTAGMLDKAYAARRRELIGEASGLHPHGDPPRGGTVYLSTADAATGPVDPGWAGLLDDYFARLDPIHVSLLVARNHGWVWRTDGRIVGQRSIAGIHYDEILVEIIERDGLIGALAAAAPNVLVVAPDDLRSRVVEHLQGVSNG